MRGLIMRISLTLLMVTTTAQARGNEPNAINGVVVDELGGAIGGAQITVRDAAGTTMRTTTTDAGGHFLLEGLAPGKYDLVAESNLFEASRASVVVAEGRNQEALRLQLKLAGLTDSVVVTGRRVESRLSETPQQIQLVTSDDIERSVAVDLTDALKKNAGVDVIQYPGLSSGVGMRGFNPEFSGINKRSLLLIDGRPSGTTNLATVLLDNVDRVEVLKGPASSIYGASAMGGVINVITRRSRGPIAGRVRLGLQSFATSDIAAKVGGSLSPRMDFDASINLFNQRNDYHVGSGVDQRPGYGSRPHAPLPDSSYRSNDAWVRLGADLSSRWRIDGRANIYRARDVLTPGDTFFEGNQSGKKNFERSTSDVRLQGQLGAHTVSSTVYTASESNHTTRVKSLNPAEQAYLPFQQFEGFISWRGVQVQDAWAWWKGNSVVFGLDSELVTNTTLRYLPTGGRTAPFAADNNKRTIGAYAENTVSINGGATVVTLGGRIDSIRTEAFDTPFKVGFTPSAATFNIFNPSVGVKQQLAPGIRAHATAGRAFVPADAGALTGYNEGIVGGRIQISQGNPNLRPERSVSFDMGVERASQSSRIDITYFQTQVSDRVVSNIVISNPAPPAPVVVSYMNALGARVRGVEADYDQRLNAHIGVSASLTHYFTHKEQLPTTGERYTNVVANNSVRTSVDLDLGSVSGRVSARYVEGRRDLDFNTAGNPQIKYEARIGIARRAREDWLLETEELHPAGEGHLEPTADELDLVLTVNRVATL
jgi:vitamin B12 transporter